MDVDLREQFESAIGREPAIRPVEETVAAGRRALRRRRLAIAGAGVAAITAVALGAGQLGGDPKAASGPIKRPEAPTQVEEQLTRAAVVVDDWKALCGHQGQPDCTSYVYDKSPVGIRADGKLTRISKTWSSSGGRRVVPRTATCGSRWSSAPPCRRTRAGTPSR